MLVVGWITGAFAALGLPALPATWVLFGSAVVLTGTYWPALAAVSMLTKAADPAVWSWAICVLQMNGPVREAFACRTAAPGPAPTWPAKR